MAVDGCRNKDKIVWITSSYGDPGDSMSIAPGTASRSACRTGGRTPRTRAAALLVASLCASLCALGSGAAHAGTVAGTIQFQPNRLGKPPERNQGFLPRIENPLRPVKRFDPLPWLIVVLEGGPVSDADTVPAEQAVVYELLGASFAVPILPVLVGAQVELKNRSHDTPTLVTPSAPDVLGSASVSLAPLAVHAFRVKEPLKPIAIRAQGSPHLQGTVVAFPHRYFARVDERGGFEIPDVPPGEWTARVWYRDGWLEGVAQRVQVGPKRVVVTVEVSPELKVVAP
jgi:hypothetical protein